MALRIALRTDKEFSAVKEFVTSVNAAGFCVREVAGENEHWHWFLEVEYRNVQAFRVQLTKKVPGLKGNGSYSATEVADLEKYVRYMCKGNSDGESPEVVWRQSILYNDEKIHELHTQYWQENRKMKKQRTGSVIDHVVDVCKRGSILWRDRDKIAEEYLRELVRRSRPINTFAAKAAVNTIQVLLCPDDEALKGFAIQL